MSKDFDILKAECIDKVRYYINLANQKWALNLDMPRIKFDLYGETAGIASSGNIIRFNPAIIAMNPDDFIGRTPGHEVAHLVTFIRFPRAKGHGDEWQHVMWNFKLPAIRCHNYDTVRTQRKRVVKDRVEEGKIITPSKFGHTITFD